MRAVYGLLGALALACPAGLVQAAGEYPWVVENTPSPVSKAPSFLIVADMEGISGTADINASDPLHPVYFAKGRKLLTDDVNAVIKGLFEGGAAKVSVVDGHGFGNVQIDYLVDQIDPRATVITQKPIDAYADLAVKGKFDGILAVAQHSKSGSGGFAAHMYTIGVEMRLNGYSLDETELMGLVYGDVGIPVIFASGDDVLARELKSMPWLEVVTVMKATSHSTGEVFPVAEVHQKLTLGAKRAAQRLSQAKIMKAVTPLRASLHAFPPANMKWAAEMPDVQYKDETVTFDAPDLKKAIAGLKVWAMAAIFSLYDPQFKAMAAHPEGKKIELAGVEDLTRQWTIAEDAKAGKH